MNTSIIKCTEVWRAEVSWNARGYGIIFEVVSVFGDVMVLTLATKQGNMLASYLMCEYCTVYNFEFVDVRESLHV